MTAIAKAFLHEPIFAAALVTAVVAVIGLPTEVVAAVGAVSAVIARHFTVPADKAEANELADLLDSYDEAVKNG